MKGWWKVLPTLSKNVTEYACHGFVDHVWIVSYC